MLFKSICSFLCLRISACLSVYTTCVHCLQEPEDGIHCLELELLTVMGNVGAVDWVQVLCKGPCPYFTLTTEPSLQSLYPIIYHWKKPNKKTKAKTNPRNSHNTWEKLQGEGFFPQLCGRPERNPTRGITIPLEKTRPFECFLVESWSPRSTEAAPQRLTVCGSLMDAQISLYILLTLVNVVSGSLELKFSM